MEAKSKFFIFYYVPEYVKDFFMLPWCERDLMQYYSYLYYKDMADERNNYFKIKKVINFDIIHHQGRGDPLHKSEKEHHTIVKEDF